MAVSSVTTTKSSAAALRSASDDKDNKQGIDSSGRSYEDEREHPVSNEYVLNVAFLSFLIFTAVQIVFAFAAKSQSMMADCAAMSVDVISYFVNFLAERLKHGNSSLTWQQLRLKRLYLELIPPLVSVATLVVVTIMALQVAIDSLIQAYHEGSPSDETTEGADEPDVHLMLLFSSLNLLLDFMNVTCFARADQAVGFPGQHGTENVHVHFEHHHHNGHRTDSESNNGPTMENTPLVPVSATRRPGQQSQGALDDTVDDDDNSTASSDVETSGMNLNMCSAWTHIAADTLRSVAVLGTAGFSFLFPQLLTPVEADSWGAVVVSIIILVSLAPLMQGLFLTALKIREAYTSSHHHHAHHHPESQQDLKTQQILVV